MLFPTFTSLLPLRDTCGMLCPGSVGNSFNHNEPDSDWSSRLISQLHANTGKPQTGNMQDNSSIQLSFSRCFYLLPQPLAVTQSLTYCGGNVNTPHPSSFRACFSQQGRLQQFKYVLQFFFQEQQLCNIKKQKNNNEKNIFTILTL